MSTRLLRSLVGLSTLLMCLPAALPAPAADRCEGTFCDFYYDHMAQPAAPAQAAPASSSAQAAPARPVPTTDPNGSLLGRLFSSGTPQQPSTGTAPAAPRKLVAVQGGGVIGMMNGTAPKRCTGTLCDLFYGGPPPEEPAAAKTEPVAAEPASDETAVPARRSRIEAPAEEETRSTCAVDARDPWRCYRR